jgi:hypothetical protein
MKKMITAVFIVGALFFGIVGQAASQNATPVPEEETAVPEEETAVPAEETAVPEEEGAGETPLPVMNLVEMVRQSTAQFRDVAAAEEAGYGLFHGCVSSPTGGAMGVHYANGDLVGDGTLDATTPEAMIYEQSYGQLRLVGVEYVVIAEAWDAANDAPPVLMGQLFNYVSAPNRYGLPAFYELHVWAWKFNPTGAFADWNPLVSCEEYTGAEMAGMTH